MPRKRETLNREFAFLVVDRFKNSEMFEDSDETKVIGEIPPFIDDSTMWYEFVVQLQLATPIKMEDKDVN